MSTITLTDHSSQGTSSGTLKSKLGPVTIPNGNALTPLQPTKSISPVIDNSEVTNARVEEILLSDIGVTTLLARLKQSIASCREFAGFLKKRAGIEEEHAQGLRKLSRLTFESPKRVEGRHGSYLRQFDEATAIHDRIAENGIRFSVGLHQMHEELIDLVASMERGRKQWKTTGINSEKKVHDSLLLLEKAKTRYDQIADRAKPADKRAQNFIGRGFARTGAQVEEDLKNRLSSAEQEYLKQAQITSAHRQEHLGIQRPQTVNALKDLIFECDSALKLQLQKFATLNEKLLLNNALCISPIKNPDSSQNVRSMRDIILMIDNEQDFKKYVLSMGPKLSAQSQNEKHSALVTGAHSPYTTTPSTPSGGTPTSPLGLPGLSREISNQSQRSQGYGAVIHQQPIIPHSQLPYFQHPPTQINTPVPPELPRDKPVFGVSLDHLLERDGSPVPIIVSQCIQAVDNYGLNVEGIYRISGTKPHIERIKNIFDNGTLQADFHRPENFFHDINSVTSVLKAFFRELPDPLLTRLLYQEFIHASQIENDVNRRCTIHGIINRLPDPNYATFRALTLHLNRVQQQSAVNRMSAGNLAICFGPTLMLSREDQDIGNTGWQVRVVETVLQNWDSIFDPDD